MMKRNGMMFITIRGYLGYVYVAKDEPQAAV